MDDFLNDVYRIIDRSINSYLNRSYKNLQVSFGCTGGQHRSVFAAEKLATHLQQNDKLIVELLHRELE
jgi:RNase adaptor protein for sRNA GlmZ degradation